MRLLTPVLLSALAMGCGWNDLDYRGNTTLPVDAPLWAPSAAVAAGDGLYVPLPASGSLTHLLPDGTVELVDVGPGAVIAIEKVPGGDRVAAFVRRFRCTTDDLTLTANLRTVDDCRAEDLVDRLELVTIEAGEVVSTLPLPGPFRELTWTADGSQAIANLTGSLSGSQLGILDLASVLVLDVDAGTVTTVPVGFAADRILLSRDETVALVLSKSEVGVLDLVAEPPAIDVTFPLTLDPDQRVQPTGVALTPDGEHAMISVSGGSDLYVLDLVQRSINVVTLAAEPSALLVVPDDDAFDAVHDDRTVIAYRNRTVLDRLDHDVFDLESTVVDEGTTDLLQVGDRALGWNAIGRKDAYLLDPITGAATEFRLENPPSSVVLAPGGEMAVALTVPEPVSGGSEIEQLYDRSHGLELLDLTSTGDRGDARAFLLRSQGVGLAFDTTDGATTALVLQRGRDELLALDLTPGTTQQPEEIDLEASPLAIGAMPAGGFWITHDRALGLVSFYDPATDEVLEVGGFAALALSRPIELEPTEEGE